MKKRTLTEEIAKMKTMMNMMGETVTDTKVICDNCKHSWDIEKGGNDVYICHECNHDNTPNKLNESTFSGNMVWNHIKTITPDEDDIPWGFKEKIMNADFANVENFSLESLLQSDPDFKEYYESGDERYDQDEMDPNEMHQEIVVVNGELLDGYSRAANLLRAGEKTTSAFLGKVKGYDKESIDEIIKHMENGKWRVMSHKGKNLGTYTSREDADKRLQQVHYFKSQG
jgi:ribosomal protein L37AE/L43A